MTNALTIRQQLALLLAGAAILLGLFFSAIMVWQKSQLQLLKGEQAVQFQQAVIRVLDKNGETLASVAADYSLWDEMFDFVSSTDSDWARVNIDESLPAYGLEHSWVTNSKGDIVYQFHQDTTAPMPVTPQQLIAANATEGIHGFTIIPSGDNTELLEIRAMPINRSDDDERSGASAGWWLVGKKMNPAILESLQVQLSADRIEIRSQNSITEPSSDWLISNSVALPMLTDDYSAYLYSTRSLQSLKKLHNIHWNTLLLTLLGLMLVLTISYLLIRRNLLTPMDDITQALDNNTVSKLKPYLHRTNEIGRLSALIVEFFKHKQSVIIELNSKKHLLKDAQKSNKTLVKESLTDELTQVGNRRAFDEKLEASWDHAVATGTDIAIVMIDIDHFKAYNDNYGHQQGDLCLKSVAALMQNSLQRKGDILTRYGGEEFALILPHTDTEGASRLTHRLIDAINKANIPHPASSAARHVTISAGVASMQAYPGSSAEMLLALADGALYEAKSQGRNCLRTDEDLIAANQNKNKHLTLVVDNPDKNSV